MRLGVLHAYDAFVINWRNLVEN